MSRNKSYILLTHTVKSCYEIDSDITNTYISTYKEYYKIIKYIRKHSSVISYEETHNGFIYNTAYNEHILTINTSVNCKRFNKSVLFKSI